ncbi:nucleotidyl transferase AbiEii/AbiGii toxin family protein [Mycobacteroides abscessus]|uniref:nucleotidyl transferase AbiEii/AbiGii toxin family protein n=1 Tax=Mycobacteroides abscessus TaxID=36809 RepID=UPI0009281350|nr:nucleotidyl transferase AbiEii/AbiGii toxin family protein [Mycobacteroides abscessus]SIK93644.1 Nucleotidyl transferase of uncharacterised function (DUF1814) [Mycobacteroides abscessus subsp. abscessus]SIN01960.1 Nucleotidyl transferase of uncharacterised function (DUF1814) [Mycobacteroides abscessus subsp. abscessus]SIN10487.1 Nucleotidyl transferase of uncharacterised function (DUF1814) [Mycobacteroides abscessus subsp. abscessus]
MTDEPGIGALRELGASGAPLTHAMLEKRVAAIAEALGTPVKRARMLISSVVVAQMLPEGIAVKGGVGIKLRLGETGTRATSDVDIIAGDREGFFTRLRRGLEIGWGTVPPSKGAVKKDPAAPPRLAFNGKVRPDGQPRPAGVPPQYVMQPYSVTLQFMGKPWANVLLEVGHDEIGGLAHSSSPKQLASQIEAMGEALGFGELRPVALISLEQQITQKIHAATEPGSRRGHDLVDLQLLWNAGGDELDMPVLAEMCRRTFAFRQSHTWPPTAAMSAHVDAVYGEARQEAAVEEGPTVQLVETLGEACRWLNSRIAEIDAN